MNLLKLSSLLILAVMANAQADVRVDPELVSFARSQDNSKTAGVYILMDTRSNSGARSPTRYQHQSVVSYLRASALEKKDAFDRAMMSNTESNAHFRGYKFYAVALTYAAVVTPEGLRRAANIPGVVKIYANRNLILEPRRLDSLGMMRGQAYPYDMLQVGYDKMNAQFPELTGKGVTIGSVDTGVDGKHPALQGKIKLFYDGKTRKPTEPYDSDEHGTHTAGTMVGTGQNGVPMGMAPQAQLIASGPLGGYDMMLDCMEFLLDPDQNPSTNDAPRAVNNSWNSGGAPDQELFYRAIDAWEAASILPVFSAGNAGPGTSTITRPHEYPNAFAVAATGANGKATDFSSRGPGIYNGQQTQKPDLAAPGDKILSSLPNGRYAAMSGTSMAAPHVTGASAILFQADPTLNPAQIRKIFLATTNPLDEAGNPTATRVWNKVYGFGVMNLFEAVKLAKNVSERRGGFFLKLADFIASPQQMLEKEILDLEQDEQPVDFTYPEKLQSPDWVMASQIWKK